MRVIRTLAPVAPMVVLLVALMPVQSVRASDIDALIEQMATDNTRPKALDELLKKGASAEVDLRKALAGGKLNDRQFVIVRRILGNILCNTSTLKLVDQTKLAPYGKDDKSSGDPTILIDPDPESRKNNKTIVMSAEFILEQGPLEYLVVSKGPGAKLHETVLAVDAGPHDICYALLACEYAFAGEITEEGAINLPKNAGVMMSVEFEYAPPNEKTGEPPPEVKPGEPMPEPKPEAPDPNRRWVRVPLEFFAFNLQTEKPMKRVPFAFTGSRFDKDPDTGKMIFIAEIERSVAAVRLDANALLNSPLNTRNVNPLHANGYSVNWELIPKRHSKCRLILEPYTGPDLTDADLTDTGEKKGEGVKPEWDGGGGPALAPKR